MTKWRVTISERACITRTIEAETEKEATRELENMLESGAVIFEEQAQETLSVV